MLNNARVKLAKKGCDLIVANDVSPDKAVFGGAHNEVHLVSAEGSEGWPRMTKEAVAERLIDRIARNLELTL